MTNITMKFPFTSWSQEVQCDYLPWVINTCISNLSWRLPGLMRVFFYPDFIRSIYLFWIERSRVISVKCIDNMKIKSTEMYARTAQHIRDVKFDILFGSDLPQMGQIRDFLRSVSVHFGSPRQIILKLILKSLILRAKMYYYNWS